MPLLTTFETSSPTMKFSKYKINNVTSNVSLINTLRTLIILHSISNVNLTLYTK